MFGGLWCHVVPVVIELFQFEPKWIVSGAVLLKRCWEDHSQGGNKYMLMVGRG